ncbi:hypothetical protein [Simiaoa sp.]|uniref:hypothetical protein n=1 Tax=Simiaoa sp. TaxID=2944202 RepID=UPI003A1A27F6
MDNIDDIEILEVFDESELPVKAEKGKKYYINLGGSKNFQCIYADSSLSRGDFMEKYRSILDSAMNPVYEDKDIVVRQDAKLALPGFYIVASKKRYDKIVDMPIELFIKCMKCANLIAGYMRKEMSVHDKIYVYYEEHYIKPMTAHFWVMPLYQKYTNQYEIYPEIFNKNIWKYVESFSFIETREKIYKCNNIISQKIVDNNLYKILNPCEEDR